MKKEFIISLFAFLVLQINSSAQSVQLDSTELSVNTVIDGIDIPWEITWGPDDYIWMTERFGRISRVNPETGDQQVLLDLSSDVYVFQEAGMLGMALHPDFETTPDIFVVYNYVNGNDILERLVRYTYDGSVLVDPEIILDNIEGFNTHNGSRLLFLPDGTLLMTTGDAQALSLPLDQSSLVGKTLRMNPDGSVPDDNPIPGSLVWSYGHRNAQGLCLGPNDIIYSSEHGPTTDDELNILEVANNYGWPEVEGFCDSPPEQGYCDDNEVNEPLVAWTPTIAPSDIIWYNHPSIPELQDQLLMTVLKEQQLISFQFNESGTEVTEQTALFTEEFGRLRDICVGPDGTIYLATNGDSWQNSDPFTHSIVSLKNESYVEPEPVDTTTVGLDNSLNSNIELFPNPAKDILNIQTGSINVDHVRIFSFAGKEIMSFQLSSALITNSINIEELSTGIYFVNISSKDKVYTEKLLVK